MFGYQSWGFYPKVEHEVIEPQWLDEDPPFSKTTGSFLPYGLGRSYGDSCLNAGGTIISTRRLNRIISFDSESGRLVCEAGMTLAEILDFAVPRGWFLPVTPGTKFVTVGGAIANDVHGKNHHRAGTFGRHVRRFELLRSNGERWVCSPKQKSEYFQATIGGLGLTGLIRWVELQLKRVAGPYIAMESIKYGNLDEFFGISAESDKGYEYTVAWLDCVARGSSFGRGIFMRGNHSEEQGAAAACRVKKQIASIPVFFPNFALNGLTVRAFNFLYYNKQVKPTAKARTHYEPFFYPLDIVGDWNRIYGKRGLLQFQCVVPSESEQRPIREILKVIVGSGRASFLAVLKEFGSAESPGLLSFPKPGMTICLDFPNDGRVTFELFNRLESMVAEMGGRMYPAKDACLSREHFQLFYPQWQEFAKFIDPRFSSSFWRRVTQ